MINHSKKTRQNKFLEQLKALAKRELPVILDYLAMVAGAAVFYETVSQVWDTTALDLKWLVIFVPMMRLSEIYPKKRRNKKQPYFLHLTFWFKEGFESLSTFGIGFSKSTALFHRLLKSLRKK